MLTINSTETVAAELRPLLLRINRRLRREALPTGTTVGQISLLVIIRERPGIGVRELAALERMSAPAMSGYVDRLESAGLVARTPVAGDRRRVGLELTAAGRKLVRSARAMRTEWLATRLRRLTDEQLSALEAALEPLGALLADEQGAA
jgi:DNA-binding MarR family transcriptional regulator